MSSCCKNDEDGGGDFSFKFLPVASSTARKAGQLANVEMHWQSGPLAGLRLVGFSVWTRTWPGRGLRRSVSVPSRTYVVGSERRTFQLLRPTTASTESMIRLGKEILRAYARWEQESTGDNGRGAHGEE